jgi:hypothetical protein
MDNIKEYSISPVSILLFVYVISFTNYFNADLSNSIKRFIDNNKFAKQLIIFLTILIIITQIYKDDSLINNVLMSVIIYFLLLFIKKSDYKFHILIFILLSIFHIYETKNKQKQSLQLSDPFLDKDYKDNLIKKNYNREKIIYGFLILLIIGGALQYERKKQNKFGENFSLIKFLYN